MKLKIGILLPRSEIYPALGMAFLNGIRLSLKDHIDKIGPVSTMGFITTVWMTVTTVAEILAERGVKLYIHPSHNIPGDTTAHDRLDEALGEYKKRIKRV